MINRNKVTGLSCDLNNNKQVNLIYGKSKIFSVFSINESTPKRFDTTDRWVMISSILTKMTFPDTTHKWMIIYGIFYML